MQATRETNMLNFLSSSSRTSQLDFTVTETRGPSILPEPRMGPPETCENQSLVFSIPKRNNSMAMKVGSSRFSAGSRTESACSRHVPQEVS